jgi:hypothetical protein
MMTNTDLKNRLKDDAKGLSEQDLNILRNFFVKMANIEYEYHKHKSLKYDCRYNKILEISNCDYDGPIQTKKAA